MKKKNKKQVIGIYIDDELLEKLKALAASEDRSLSRQVVKMLNDAIKDWSGIKNEAVV